MKLGAVLLASLSTPAEGGRKWNLLTPWKLARSGGFVEGGRLQPRVSGRKSTGSKIMKKNSLYFDSEISRQVQKYLNRDY